MIERKVQEENTDSIVDNDSKIPRQENDNMEPLTLNGKATFILVFIYIFLILKLCKIGLGMFRIL